MNRQLLNRRQFTARCAAFGLSVSAVSVMTASQADPKDAGTGPRTVKLPDGTTVAAVGQGCWHLGQARHPPAVEEDALRTGISLGMTLLDTSGNYGRGLSEELLSNVVGTGREQIFLVSKVEGDEVSGDGIARACAASLGRLKTPYLDLYLMHWPPASSTFAGMVAAFEKLRAEKKIRAWGVSNFDARQMQELVNVPNGNRCVTNQVAYSINRRNIEAELLPWHKQHNMPIMAYSPLGGDKNLVVKDRTLAKIGAAHGCTAAAVALAWAIRGGNVIAIPESGSPEHTKENAVALSLSLSPEELRTLDAAFPGPRGAG